MIGSPISMSHYLQNIQSFLTGRFKMLHMVFKSEFDVKKSGQGIWLSFPTLNRCLFEKDVQIWDKFCTAGESECTPSLKWRT